MGDTVLLTYTPPTVAEDFCPANWQEVYDKLDEAVFRLDSTGYSFYNYGDTTPAAEYRMYPWLRTVGGKPDRWYVHYGNYWIAPHPEPANSSMRHIWVGANDATGLWAYDGGDGTDPALATEYAGAMWEVDTAFAARFPIGVGTTAGGTAVAVTNTGGEDEHTITEAEMPEHTHVLCANVSAGAAEVLDAGEYLCDEGVAGSEDYNYVLGGTATEPTVGQVANTGGSEAMSLLPPYYGVWFVKRTDRAWYTIPD